MIGISSSAHACAMPLSKISVAQRLNSTSTAEILCTLLARRIVLALHSERLMPPSVPFCIYGTMASMLVSMGVFGSTRAHSNRSSFFLPSNTLRHSSILRLTFSVDPSGVRLPGTRPPLIEMTILSTLSGYWAK